MIYNHKNLLQMLARFTVIVACDSKGGIGKLGNIPWSNSSEPKQIAANKKDMNSFRTITSQRNYSNNLKNACIMGKETFISMGKPLTDRFNIIISKTISKDFENDDIKIFSSIFDALVFCKTNANKTFIIGGQNIYSEAYEKYNYLCDEIIRNNMEGDYNCDRFFLYPNNDVRIHQEQQYLNIMREILAEGSVREDRTGTGTKGVFGRSMKFDLREAFPLLTTKKVFFNSVVKELLFFISGKTDCNLLKEQGVNIWNGNTSKDFLERRGLNYREGDMGPGYSFQWRHCGESYEGCDKEYAGIDQIKNLVNSLKNDPFSRRHLLVAWNVCDIEKMALPPCHCLAQFYVHEDILENKFYLDCRMYQRSADMFLGVPFNIASYSLLTHILANMCGYIPRYYYHDLGDTHIYLNHIDKVETQIKRLPHKFPNITLKNDNIFEIKFEDIQLNNYSHHPIIKADMAI